MCAAAVAMAVLGCGQPSPSDAVVKLAAVFPTLAEYQVSRLYTTDGCEYIVYERGAFVTDPASEECQIDVEGPYPRSPIDTETRGALDAIYRASEVHGPRLQMAFPEYATDGTIVGGDFGFAWCLSYVYDPGWATLPPSTSETYAAVDRDWYEVSAGSGC